MSIHFGRRQAARRVGLAVTLAVAAVASLATPALAIEVHHSTGRTTVAQAAWGSTDPETFTGRFGLAYAYVDGGRAGIGLYEEDSAVVDCGDGMLGVSGTVTTGESPAGAVTIASNLGSAVASGTVELTTFAFDGCSGTAQLIGQSTVSVALSLVASGRREVTTDRFADAVNGEFRFTSTTRTASRPATGSVEVDGVPIAYAAASIAAHSFSSTSVGH